MWSVSRTVVTTSCRCRCRYPIVSLSAQPRAASSSTTLSKDAAEPSPLTPPPPPAAAAAASTSTSNPSSITSMLNAFNEHDDTRSSTVGSNTDTPSVTAPPTTSSNVTTSTSTLTTPSSNLSSESSSSTTSSLSSNLEVEELRNNKSFLERLQDLWYERSGTSEILELKESVNEASLAFDRASVQVNLARRHLDESLRNWERTSGKHLQLLQRRESWTPDDAQNFANLVSQEIMARSAMEKARNDLATAEETLSKRQLEYMNRMRRRYHEEQIWQDQWRVLGTYGTWSLIVLNSCVFLGSQYFLRVRENARMKAIEELIRENRVHNAAAHIPIEQQPVDVPTPSQQTTSTSLAKETTAPLTNTTDKIESKEPFEDSTRQKNSVENLQESTVWQESTNWREKILFEWQNVHSTAVHKWQQLQSRSKTAFQTIQQKTQNIVAAIPALQEMPKSVDEVHVPSAIVGASFMGAVVVVVMFLVPTKR
ncbi:She9 / Mdm33 family protein [Nitzschia inconspicua]|uniref:She9 / Mdm33 family protein n=1 Tax=Nitzschia inconspicua TaxID=303405 RepID=A0A9K3L3T3_9STRA|nr:She9 / Mdm33 family protein [Nitzschia inconspicua]